MNFLLAEKDTIKSCKYEYLLQHTACPSLRVHSGALEVNQPNASVNLYVTLFAPTLWL